MTTTYYNEQFGYDIFADDMNIDADSELYYCDGADEESAEQELVLRCNEQIILCNNGIYNCLGEIFNIMINEQYGTNTIIVEVA